MKIYRIAELAILWFVLSIVLAAAGRADDKAVQGWDPEVFRDTSTIKIMTTEPDVGEHWSNLWVVVIDEQPYVRLGDRAYGRIQRNTTSPYGPGAITSRSEKTRFVRKCHKLSVTRGRVGVERRKEYGGAAADDLDHGDEARGSGWFDC
jgi:hypothetical protein